MFAFGHRGNIILIHLQIYSLATHEEKRSHDELHRCEVVSSSIFRQLSKNSPWSKQIQSGKRASDVLAKLLFHFILSNSINVHLSAAVSDDKIVGRGVYPYISLLNHSCAPNVICVGNPTKQFVIALCDIKTGEQLFISYGLVYRLNYFKLNIYLIKFLLHFCNLQHGNLHKHYRLTILNDEYHFKCRCIACTENYPQIYCLDTEYIPRCEVDANTSVCLRFGCPENVTRKLTSSKSTILKCTSLSSVSDGFGILILRNQLTSS